MRTPERRAHTRPGRQASLRALRPRERLDPIEAIALVVVCAAFAGLIAYTFSRLPASWPNGDPNRTPHAPRRADAPSTSIVTDAASCPACGTPERPVTAAGPDAFDCPEPRVTDGDTLRCGPVRVRLASIDAPEMPGHCRRGRACTPGDPFASTDHLRGLVEGRSVTCRQTDIDHYGRVVALCTNGREDLSCSQVRSGYAVIRYGDLACS